MTPSRFLIFSSLQAQPDPWGDWMWELAAQLQENGVEPRIVLTESVETTSAPYREARVHGFDCFVIARVLPPAPGFADLFSNEPYDGAIDRLLANEAAAAGPFDAAIIHRLRGHTTSLPRILRAAGVPMMHFLADAWPYCPRSELHSAGGEICIGPELDRCAPCIEATWPGIARGKKAGEARLLVRALLDQSCLDLNTAELLVLPTERQRAALRVLQVPRSRAFHMPVQVASAVAAPERARVLPLSRGPVRLGFVGEPSPANGIWELLAAFARLPATVYELAIWGPLRPYHGDRADHTRLRQQILTSPGVSYRGSYAMATLPELFDEIDVLVVPEHFGDPTATAAEVAVRRGTYVVSSEGAPAARVVEPGVNGQLFEPGNTDELTDAIRETARLVADDPRAAAPVAAQGPAPVAEVLEISRRLKLPDGAPPGVSHWSDDLSQRVLVTSLDRRTGGHLLYPLRWTGGEWLAAAQPRQILDSGLLLPHLERLLAG